MCIYKQALILIGKSDKIPHLLNANALIYMRDNIRHIQ